MPLSGVLTCRYDYDRLRPDYSRESARQAILFPALAAETTEKLLLAGNTPVYRAPRLARAAGVRAVWLKDETVEPTGSLKDRASWLVTAIALQQGKTVITCASTGNAASSLAGMCAAAGVRCVLFVPAAAPRAKLIQPAAYGACVLPIDSGYDDCFELSLLATERFGWYNRNTAYNPWTIEGKKSCAWELACQLDFNLPDQVFVPTGDGVILSGMYKGFYDLQQLGLIDRIPMLVAVQPSGADALAAALARNSDGHDARCAAAASIADSLVVQAPRNAVMALHALRATGGYGITVSEEEILEAVRDVSSQTGIFVEPAAAAAWAGLKKAREEGRISAKETAALLLTGSGLKDIAAAERAVNIPKALPANLDAIEERLENGY